MGSLINSLIDVDTSRNNLFTKVKYKGNNLLFKKVSNGLSLVRFLKTSNNEIDIPLTINDGTEKKTIESIEPYALEGRNLEKITINAKAIYSGGMGVNNTTSIIEIGRNVNQIDVNFNPYSKDYKMVIDKDNTKYFADEGILYENNNENCKLFLVFKTLTGNIELKGKINGKNVTEISYSAFSEQKKVISIKIPNTITTIRDQAFYNCISLKKIEIPSTVKIIENSAFYNCSSLDAGADNGTGGIRIDNTKNVITGAPWGARKGDRAVKWLR